MKNVIKSREGKKVKEKQENVIGWKLLNENKLISGTMMNVSRRLI